MRVGQRSGLYARPRRPTLDGPAPDLHLHGLYAGERKTSHPAAPPTLPKLASGLSGVPHAAGHPKPSPAAHVEFFFIGLAGRPVSLTPRETSHPAALPTLPKLASGLSGAPHAAWHPNPLPRCARCFFLYRPSGPAGITHTAGNPAPSRAACAAKIGCRACRHHLRRGKFHTFPRRDAAFS